MGFAKVFDYPNDTQILVTKDYEGTFNDEDEGTYKLCFEIQYQDASTKISINFASEEGRNTAFEETTSEQAKKLFDSLFKDVEGWE